MAGEKRPAEEAPGGSSPSVPPPSEWGRVSGGECLPVSIISCACRGSDAVILLLFPSATFGPGPSAGAAPPSGGSSSSESWSFSSSLSRGDAPVRQEARDSAVELAWTRRRLDVALRKVRDLEGTRDAMHTALQAAETETAEVRSAKADVEARCFGEFLYSISARRPLGSCLTRRHCFLRQPRRQRRLSAASRRRSCAAA
jgi:hypothetical protein